ncbi:MAG: glycosyltransferase [Myxococcota bacterium]|nr:glycosyltransferase [Myxococcota bacterium]
MTTTSLAIYAATMALFVRAMLKRRDAECAPIDRAPRVTIFKPLAGQDDDLEANLESFARIDYPSFEILLGVASPTDPAYPVARRFVARHVNRVGVDVRIVITDPDAAINPKVAQLLGLERVATGDVYVLSDSNVRVRPGYLWSLVAELADPRAGMVTSLFAGAGEQTLGAALENLQLCASTVPAYVAMNAVSARPLTVGKSMAVRRRDLARLGGFAPVGDVLAEDYALGRRFLDAGFLVRTSLHTVENRNVACSMMRTVERHTRWSKLRRALFPAGFAVEPLLTPIVVASLAMVLAPGESMATLLGVTCLLQTASALVAVRVLRGGWLAWWYAPLEIVRSYVTFFCWLRATLSRRLEWRGHVFTLTRGSVIARGMSTSARSSRRARLLA